MYDIIFLILGILGLILGTELIIRGSLNIAEHFKISQLFIGLTILAIGTDLPELAIDITGAIHRLQGIETSDLIIGETIGTTLAQIAFTLGVLGLIAKLTLSKKELLRDGLVMLISVILLILASLDGQLTRIEGIIFVLIYIFYFITVFREERIHEDKPRAPKIYTAWAILSLIVGFAFLIYCSNLIVATSTTLATKWGISQSFIGAVILGLGTSLPELSVSIAAFRKGALKLSVGNLIGSNIFDILFTLGISTSISGFLVSKNFLHFDLPFLLIVSALVLLFFTRKMILEKKEALLLILIYAFYVFLKIFGF